MAIFRHYWARLINNETIFWKLWFFLLLYSPKFIFNHLLYQTEEFILWGVMLYVCTSVQVYTECIDMSLLRKTCILLLCLYVHHSKFLHYILLHWYLTVSSIFWTSFDMDMCKYTYMFHPQVGCHDLTLQILKQRQKNIYNTILVQARQSKVSVMVRPFCNGSYQVTNHS